MRGNFALIPILLGICVAIPAQAAETSPLKCGVNEDRIWVYDSLNSFDVAMKLKCGEPVEILSREKGYVKIRIAGGREGWVEAKALPKPSGAEEPNQSSSEAQASQKQRQLVAAAASHDRAPVSAAGTSVRPVESAPANGNATKSDPVPDTGRSASSSASSTKSPTPAVAEKNTSVAAPNNVAGPEQPSAASVPDRAGDRPIAHSPASATKAVDSTATTKAVHTTSSTTKSSRATVAAKTDSNNADAKVKASSSKTVTVSSLSTTTPKATKAASTKAVSSKTAAASRASIVVEPATPPPSANVALADNISIEPQPDSRSAHAGSPGDPDEEDAPMESLGSKESCKLYFSAYGLSPNQYRWMTQSRGKNFSGICPAPAPTMVDFVVIFTHDADFFNGTMPTPVHTDKNGFSDFTPLSTIDTAVVSPSDADKNRREYVWVFHTKRGTFNPATFSPKRRPLFSTTESNKLGTAAGSRSAEDALRFIEQHGADR
jgi:SH3 domain-containing protein